jgi:hypothetical protein
MTTRVREARERNGVALDALRAARKALKAAGARRNSMLVLEVETAELVPRVWRRLRVDSRQRLSVFDDCVLRPAFGYARGHHLSVFRIARGETIAPELELADRPSLGEIEPMPLCFGPQLPDACGFEPEGDIKADAEDPIGILGSVDMIHINLFFGGSLCNSRQVRLSDVLVTTGDRLEWAYDLGEPHRFTVTLVAIEEGTMRSERNEPSLLDGAGAHLPVDHGSVEELAVTLNRLWPPFSEARIASDGCGDTQVVPKTGAPLLPEFWWSVYNALRARCLPALSPDFLCAYDPLRLNFDATVAAIRLACRTVEVGAGLRNNYYSRGWCGPAVSNDGGVSAEQNLSALQDATPSCLNCGTLVGLMKCSKCLTAYFCSQACIVGAWPTHKRACKAMHKNRLKAYPSDG